MKSSYSEAQKEWLKNNYPKLGGACLTAFNKEFGCAKKPGTLKTYCNRALGLNAPSDGRIQKSYTSEMENWLKENHQKYLRCELTEQFNKKFGTNVSKKNIQAKLQTMGLKVDKREVYEKFGKEISHKISKVQDDRLGIGSEKIYGGFVYIKIRNGAGAQNFKLKHYIIWEKAHNQSVPKGMCVIFLDGNKRNFDIDNLALVDKQTAKLLTCYNAYGKGEFTKKTIEYINIENEIRKMIGYKRDIRRK